MSINGFRLGPSFWLSSALALRGDACAQTLACYLMTGPAANVYGLYTLSLSLVAEHLGFELESVVAALQRIEATGLSRYDQASASVWLPSWAQQQLGALKPTDHRVAAANRWYVHEAPNSPFLEAFYDRYHQDLHLRTKRRYAPSAVVAIPTNPVGRPTLQTPVLQVSPPNAPASAPVTVGQSNGPAPHQLALIDTGATPKPPDRAAELEERRQRLREVERWFHERFWPRYPRKTAKKDAIRAVLKLLPDEETRMAIEAALARHCATVWARPGAPIPHPATWINGERWMDEVETVVGGDYVSQKTHRIARSVEEFVNRGDET